MHPCEISPCGTYRYALWRTWQDEDGLFEQQVVEAGESVARTILFLMLNPSDADGSINDPTMRRCIGFAKSWGFGRLSAGNLYAFRSPSPAVMRAAADPVGPENDAWLKRLAEEAEVILCAWGAHADEQRVFDVVSFLPREKLHTFTTLDGSGPWMTKGGAVQPQPRHPLYIPASVGYVRVVPSGTGVR